jgi:hypothetical protein
MKLTQDVYPVFEANQVLSDLHLNEIFGYLDEQERLTRANLIGIGIVCGLEISFDQSTPPTIQLTKGCGVTSEGYLVLEPQDVALVSYREYTLPDEPGYPSLKDSSSATGEQFDLWELFPAGEPGTTPFGTPAGFLKDKAVLLFLELKKEGLRNCSPNNCDDKGAKITATVRRLLIKVQDLEKVIAGANELDRNLTRSDLATALLTRLNLPDLRLPRFDVRATGPATSRDVLAAFLTVFQAGRLAKETGNALTAAYNAFKPLVGKVYPSNPFVDFAVKFGFLDSMPKTAIQVRFLQYYYDLFDDLLNAYNEFRWKGAELLCACCPSESLFPRHLMLGALLPNAVSEPSLYRHGFLRSPAVGDCQERTNDLLVLFKRLVEMIARFSDAPQLSEKPSQTVPDPQIRITPSKAGDIALSEKAIPYYYDQRGIPPLYHLWNAEKLRRKRAHHNLGYRSDEYVPPAPAYVKEAARYDLEPFNFLRIEGHLGKNYQDVLASLLTLRNQYRLPIEIIALRTGGFDERITVDIDKEQCRFEDLETQFDALREEILWTLREGVRFLYDAKFEGAPPVINNGVPQLALLKPYATNLLVSDGSVGAWYEQNLTRLTAMPYIDVDHTRIENNTILLIYCVLFGAGTPVPDQFRAHIVGIYYFTKLAEVLPQQLDALSFSDFENKYQDLIALLRYIRKDVSKTPFPADLAQFIPGEDLIDHFDEVLYSCKLEPMRAIHEEYERRIREVKRKQFLSTFLTKHPGIQHKAGVPLGGTFIVVYHETPALVDKALGGKLINIRKELLVKTGSELRFTREATVDTKAVSNILGRMKETDKFAGDENFAALFTELTGTLPIFTKPIFPIGSAKQVIDTAVEGLSNGTVIADFFLPYVVCSSDCSPVQFVLPKTPPTFTVEVGCTDLSGAARVMLSPKGGEAPYAYRADESREFQPLENNTVLSLKVGTHTLTIQDGAGVESAPQKVVVPEALSIGEPVFEDNMADSTYTITATILGGTQPYSVPAEVGKVEGDTFTSVAFASGKTLAVEVADSLGCKAAREFTHTVCDLPCGGVSRLCAYRLWIQPPADGFKYEAYSQGEGAITFRFNNEDIELPGASKILQAKPAELNEPDGFTKAMARMVKGLNEALGKGLEAKLGPKGKNRLVVGYKPVKSDPFGVLWIEHFVCDTFSIQFDFAFAKPAPTFRLTWRYTNEPKGFNGAIMMINRDRETRVPAFSCSERNQCTDSEYEKLCQGPDPKFKFDVVPRGDNSVFSQAVGSNDIVAWVWDVSARSSEPFYEGKQVAMSLERLEGVVRVTAITNKGCFGVDEQNVQP